MRTPAFVFALIVLLLSAFTYVGRGFSLARDDPGTSHDVLRADGRAQRCRYEENCDCAAPGVTIRWKAAYCMALNETDDLEQGGAQRCLSRRDPASLTKQRACEQNAYWKQRLCAVVHKHDRKAIDNCIRDRSRIPRFVETGPGDVQ